MSTDLKYHAQTFELLGIEPVLCHEARTDPKYLADLPAAVKEWYQLENAIRILHSFSNCDQPLKPEKFELLAAQMMPDPVRIEKRWWEEVSYGPAHGAPKLRAFAQSRVFMWENQGVCSWSFELNGSPDPAVIVKDDICARLVSEHFSTFIYTQILDHRFSDSVNTGINGIHKPFCYGLTANAVQFSPRDQKLLTSLYHALPKTYGWPGAISHRFESKDGYILIWDNLGQADWFLCARSTAALKSLAKNVWSCGDLARSLFGWDKEAERLLEGLRSAGGAE